MAFDPFAPFIWKLGHGRQIELGPRAVIMGVLNVTPDSFSDGGRYERPDAAIRRAKRMAGQGAAIIDVGGESSRPGFEEISAAEEQDRILPVFEALRGGNMLLSVDTWRAETAELAVKAGAHIINDIWGFQRDPQLAEVAAKHGAGCVLMHTGRDRQKDAGEGEQDIHDAHDHGIEPAAEIGGDEPHGQPTTSPMPTAIKPTRSEMRAP